MVFIWLNGPMCVGDYFLFSHPSFVPPLLLKLVLAHELARQRWELSRGGVVRGGDV